MHFVSCSDGGRKCQPIGLGELRQGQPGPDEPCQRRDRKAVGAVEVDETYIGRIKGVAKKRAGAAHKNTVLSLLDRETGKVRSVHVAMASVDEVAPIVRANVSGEAHLIMDQAKIYKKLGSEFARHDRVNHQEDEYVRREGERSSPRTRLKATSQFSSAVCAAPISTVLRSTYTAIWRSSISAITIARHSA